MEQNQRMLLIQEEPMGPFYLIEVQVTNANPSVTLPIIQELQSSTSQKIVIKGLSIITQPEMTFGPRTGLPNAPLTELQKISALWYVEGWQKGFNMPLLLLNNTFTEGSGIPWRDRTTKLANWSPVDWNKSTFNFANGQVPVGFPYCIILAVEYERFDLNGKIVIGPSTA